MSDSKENSPLGNVMGTIGAICGFIIGWKASHENFATALITGIIIGALAAFVGNEVWKVLIAAASLIGSITNFYIRQEVRHSFTQSQTTESKKSSENTFIWNRDKNTSPGTSSSSSSNDDDRPLYFFNHCLKPVRMVIRYHKPGGEWTNTGWFNFDASEDNYLGADEKRLRTDYPFAYFYAEIPGEGINWAGDNEFIFDGQTLKMNKTELTKFWGRYQFAIECPNYDQIIRQRNPYMIGVRGSYEQQYTLTGTQYPWVLIINEVIPGSPAQADNLSPGDIIYKVDGNELASKEYLNEYINEHRDEKIDIWIVRNGERYYSTVKPVPLKE